MSETKLYTAEDIRRVGGGPRGTLRARGWGPTRDESESPLITCDGDAYRMIFGQAVIANRLGVVFGATGAALLHARADTSAFLMWVRARGPLSPRRPPRGALGGRAGSRGPFISHRSIYARALACQGAGSSSRPGRARCGIVDMNLTDRTRQVGRRGPQRRSWGPILSTGGYVVPDSAAR